MKGRHSPAALVQLRYQDQQDKSRHFKPGCCSEQFLPERCVQHGFNLVDVDKKEK
jgi:hypothetical protein